jgi:hypothetical protein
MNRFSRFFAVCTVASAVAFASCASDPVARPQAGVEKFGAGGAEESESSKGSDGSARGSSPSKAATVAPSQKIKTDEMLARVSLYEADIDAKIAAHDYSGAIDAYESAVDILTGIPASLQRIEGNRSKIVTALDAIRLDAVSSPGETPAGTAFKKDFSVLAYVLEGDAKTPLAGFRILVSGPNGAEERMTGEDGTLSYTAPVPEKPGKGELVMSAALDSTESALRDGIAFEKEKGFLRHSFPHVVSSNAKKFATTISILDFDKAGNPIKSNNFSATTLLKPLVQKGFSRIGMADFPTQLASGDEEALLKAAKAQFGSAVRRFIYGTVRIESVSQGDDGTWTCVVKGDIAVYDFTDSASVYRTTVYATKTGKTEAAAMQAARTELAGSVIVQDLYYNM